MAEHREDLDALKASISLVNIVSRSIKLIKRGSRYRALCPFHNERTPSFHVFDDHFHCFGCGRHGDHLAWFTEFERLDFVGAVDRLRAFTGIAPPSTVEIPQSGASIPKHEPNANAIAIWRAGVAVGGTCADRFLQARGITIAAPPSLRAGTDLYLGQYQLPTLVAAVQAPDRTIIAVQVTMIDPRGHKKAQITVPRRTVGALGWGATRLAAATDKLGIVEGAEKGLAAMQLFGVPCWSCLGGARMHRVWIPDNVRELHIFADSDDAGRAAAERTAEAHRRRRVVIRFPPDGSKDWDDVTRAMIGAAA